MAATTDAKTDSKDIIDEIASRAPSGLLIPSKQIRNQIEKTAGYVARNGQTFEDKLRNSGTVKLSFLQSDDPYLAYYQWRLSEIRAGKGNLISAGRENEIVQGQTGVSGRGREERKGPEKPEEFQFSARMPNISAQDLEVVKLTALWVAKNGRAFMSQLAQREAGNFQFDFLRPQHSLYQFFSRLVDQYTELIQGESVDGGRPQKKRITELEANVSNRFRVLERAKKRAEWVKWQEAQKVAKDEAEEKEKVAYAQIDWHDFTVVETVLFTEEDDSMDLPPPTTLNDLQSASLEQKAAMSIRPDRRIEEAMPTFNDYDQFYGQPQQPQQPSPYPQAPQIQMPPPPPQQAYAHAHAHATPPATTPYQPPPQNMDPEATRLASLRADRDRARAAQEAARSAPANLKIRDTNTYIPRAAAQQSRQQQPPNTSLCPNCGTWIANSEIEQHMRIELMDPNWRDQHRVNVQRSALTNLSTREVAGNLKRLASQRTDVFEERAGKRVEGEVGAQDAGGGVGGGGDGGQMMGVGVQAPEGMGRPVTDVQEQIRQLHQKYKT
ncbi:hypothetical protein BAUCODRAFT_429022 [Baudoinia panamericana UAMH 10762]|uniref:SURP motif domain-containing protein n=1 Tax=Baudoinia panamericana (strain UAMH 10762) TaxID=717646 RepID=M2NHM3_BAUPA|nr:uncharacterized protein BAUCODRAFT_429022 [Baudoinia panamericana UAMH 10762]EMC98525.1 hypothetical protein BAUCODRAFT_429022 [Baudoinia panamericana UAMH 10762]